MAKTETILLGLKPGMSQPFHRSVFVKGKRRETFQFIPNCVIEIADKDAFDACRDAIGQVLSVYVETDNGVKPCRQSTNDTLVDIALFKSENEERLAPHQQNALDNYRMTEDALGQQESGFLPPEGDDADLENADPLAEIDLEITAAKLTLDDVMSDAKELDPESDEFKKSQEVIESLHVDILALEEQRSTEEKSLIADEIEELKAEIDIYQETIDDGATSSADKQSAKKETTKLRRKLTNATKRLEKLNA